MLRMRTFLLLALAATLLSGAASADTKLLARIAPMQPPGWDSPLVPRVSAGSLATDALTTAPGLAPTSPVWINWAVSTNAAVNGTWVDQLELDGVPVQLLPRRKQAFAAQNWFAMDAGPLYVTTVLAVETTPGHFKAMHSRHEFTPTRMEGFTSRPEMYVGECTPSG